MFGYPVNYKKCKYYLDGTPIFIVHTSVITPNPTILLELLAEATKKLVRKFSLPPIYYMLKYYKDRGTVSREYKP